MKLKKFLAFVFNLPRREYKLNLSLLLLLLLSKNTSSPLPCLAHLTLFLFFYYSFMTLAHYEILLFTCLLALLQLDHLRLQWCSRWWWWWWWYARGSCVDSETSDSLSLLHNLLAFLEFVQRLLHIFIYIYDLACSASITT